MIDADHPVILALDAVIARCRQQPDTLLAAHDPDWPSPCERGEPDAAGRIRWEPVPRRDFSLFDDLERAIEEPVHADLKAFYGCHWRHHLPLLAPQGEVTLLGVLNPRDVGRLNENQLGHLQQQRRFFGLRRRLPMTLFFATTGDDSEWVLSLDNHAGEVIAERPGTRQWRVVAPTLAGFLQELKPRDGR